MFETSKHNSWYGMNVGTNDRNHKIMKFLMEVSEILEWNREMSWNTCWLIPQSYVMKKMEMSLNVTGSVINLSLRFFCCQSTAWSMNIKIRNLPSCPTTCRYIFNRFLIKVIPAFIKEVGITIILNFFHCFNLRSPQQHTCRGNIRKHPCSKV